MSVELTDEQKELKRKVIHWYHNFPYGKPYFYYSGAAGTGKTTVLKSIIDDLNLNVNEYIACAYIGKAVLVLLKNGLPASTIHSLIYMPKTEAYFETEFDEWGSPKRVKKYKSGFFLKDSLPKDLKLIFLDECAMVNDKMRQDLESFGIPIVMCGDQNQLPPVFGQSSILDNPDFVLNQIMRQAEGDPIVHLSQCVLNLSPIDFGNYGKSRVLKSIDIDRNILTDYDIILCAKNKTREELNDRIRSEVLGYHDRTPRIGDKVICRRNNWHEKLDEIYLTNGLVGYLEDVNLCSLHRDIVYANFRPDFMDEPFEKLKLDYYYMKSDWKTRKDYGWSNKDEMELFEYGYAITVHLSQGSEYQNVLFMDELFRDAETLKRLRYTAITRARNSITWIKMEEPQRKYFNYNGALFEIT